MKNMPVEDAAYNKTHLVALFDINGDFIHVQDSQGNVVNNPVDKKPRECKIRDVCLIVEKTGAPGNCFWISGRLYCI